MHKPEQLNLFVWGDARPSSVVDLQERFTLDRQWNAALRYNDQQKGRFDFSRNADLLEIRRQA